MILNDPSLKDWTWLDLRLIKAYELRLTYGDTPPWIDRSDRVSFDVKTFVSKSAAAVERKQGQDEKAAGKTPQYGKRYYAVPRVNDGGPMPTMEEYFEDQKRKQGNGDGKRRR